MIANRRRGRSLGAGGSEDARVINPFSACRRMIAAGFEMQSNWLRGLETLQASGVVIGARMGRMRDAAGALVTADVAEFARMVPEKVEAFTRSAHSVALNTIAIQGIWAAQMQQIGAMMLAGRMPTVGEASRLMSQSADNALAAVTASAKLGRDALAPIHRTATDNARRLMRAKPR